MLLIHNFFVKPLHDGLVGLLKWRLCGSRSGGFRCRQRLDRLAGAEQQRQQQPQTDCRTFVLPAVLNIIVFLFERTLFHVLR